MFLYSNIYMAYLLKKAKYHVSLVLLMLFPQMISKSHETVSENFVILRLI